LLRFARPVFEGFIDTAYSVPELLGGNSQVLPETGAARTAANRSEREHHAVATNA
jgi:hypothetical protein